MLQPPMNKTRMDLIIKAFHKLDKTGDGIVNCEDLKGVYNCSQHPKYKSGEMTEEQILNQFISTFDSIDKDGQVRRIFVISLLGASVVTS